MSWKLQLVFGSLMVVLLALQYRLWVGEGSLAEVAAGTEVERGLGYWLVLGLGLAATVAVTAFVTRIARRALQQEVDHV